MFHTIEDWRDRRPSRILGNPLARSYSRPCGAHLDLLSGLSGLTLLCFRSLSFSGALKASRSPHFRYRASPSSLTRLGPYRTKQPSLRIFLRSPTHSHRQRLEHHHLWHSEWRTDRARQLSAGMSAFLSRSRPWIFLGVLPSRPVRSCIDTSSLDLSLD